MFRSTTSKVALIILFALVIGYYDLPNAYQKVPGTPASVKDHDVVLGLDLQGGSQLDYKIDLRKVPEKDQKAIVEGVKEVINKRVNSLGVSEPNIYTSTIGDEQHLIVELAGVKDLNEAKAVVGKTIQLEFKEQREKIDPAHKENVRKQAQAVLQKALKAGSSFDALGDEENKAAPDKVQFTHEDWKFRSEVIDLKIADAIFPAGKDKVIPRLLEGNMGYTLVGQKFEPLEGFFVIKVIDKRDTSALPENEKSLKVSHILVSYKGADKAPESVSRTKEEAKARAEELRAKLVGGANFETTAKESSDEPGARDSAGALSAPVKKDNGDEKAPYVKEFTNAALKLTKKGELSGVVETPFGFHMIRADDFSQVKFDQLFYSSADDPWQETGLTGQYFQHADVTFDNFLQPEVAITFNAEGAKLFEKITERNIDKPVAIFVGGELKSSPTVRGKISGGQATISGGFRTPEEAQVLARDLNTGAIPAPVILSGQYTIGATLGQEALNRSVKAGIVGVVLLALFMILYYRLPGLVAVVALSLYATILLFLIKSTLPMAVSIIIAGIIFAAIVYKILQSNEGGWEKFITFILACFILFFVTFLLSNPIVLTLAGIAGVVLSIGMAVDANVLIFERMKEELRAGRPLSSAIDVGFDRAWSSIRDSNFSSLITCAILFYFGTSIIQGFAFNLAAGILVSMFTAITITKTLLTALMKTKLGENLWLWGYTPASHQKTYNIIKKSKTWFTLSGTILAISLIALVVFGLKLGIDFNGGTLMDVQFEKNVTVDQVKTELKNVQDTLNKEMVKTPPPPSSQPALSDTDAPLDLDSARIVPAGENHYMLHLQHIDNEAHEAILAHLKQKLGNVTENRFTTIGPIVGETLKRRAVLAVVVTMVAIVLYMAFAFRKVPRRVSPWKFGICAIAALIHDVLIPIGVFALFKFEVDALFITAILTVLGFSVHDTIVVFDRIRENLKYQGRDESFDEVANKSMSQTMARSINTSVTTLITLVALLVLGSPSLFTFILVLVIGIIVGTYSSIFIASPLLVLWQNKSEKSSQN